MKIAVVSSYAPSLVNFRGALLASLADQGHELTAFAPDFDRKTRDWLRERGIAICTVPIERTGTSPREDLRTLKALTLAFRKLKPDVVFTYTVKPEVWGTLAAFIARVPRRVAMVTGLGHAFTDTADRQSHVARIVRGLYATALRAATCVIFHNDDDRQQFQREKLVPSDGRAVVVHGSGVDLARFEMQPLPPEPITFLLISRLLAEKGVREFVDAARIVKKSHPEARFRLVGPLDTNPSGIGQAEVDAWNEEGAVEVVGPLADVRDALTGCHVYVLPSYREGLPRTNLEAMATGRAIITTDVPGCRHTVWPDNGILVPARDAEALAAACIELMGDMERMTAMGRASRCYAEDRFAVEKVNEAMREHITGQTEAL